MFENNRNVILAIVLSVVVLFGWQYFVAGPQLERAQRQAEIAAQQAQQADPGLAHPNGNTANATPGATPAAGETAVGSTFATRDAAIAATQRAKIETGSLEGSINLTGGRLDDLHLKNYRETVDPNSPIITLLTPAGVEHAYFVEQGWVPQTAGSVRVPDASSVWTVDGENATLTETAPVTIKWDNGEGLTFRRTFSVDDRYLFT
ncbi:MAG: membrane protein insertase YidC, partial [Devosia nanyangense]|nr:membrane protein insertase YidC [Devosia nanyangense]